MKNNFPHVFSPLTIRGMTLKNRVVMMPMGSDFAVHILSFSYRTFNWGGCN